MASPLLDPPCPGWQSDLPGPETVPVVPQSLGFDTPNHMDDAYLEISRRWLLARGIAMWFGLFMFIWLAYIPEMLKEAWGENDFAFIPLGLGCLGLGIWSGLLFLRLDISPPRDLPIRVNRARQKLYAYNFKYSWWNPFGWRVMPVAYDWSQIRAERWKHRGFTAQGVLIIKWGVTLSVVAPGTNKVIDRFPLSTMGADEHAWAYLCTYMQQGPQALPPPGPPRDCNRAPWYNLARLLAPKVKWPPDMDLESRSAP